MKKILATTLLIFPLAYGIENINYDAMVFGGYLNYSNSEAKDYGYYMGLFGYMGINNQHTLEGSVSYTNIKYLDGGTLNQFDYTGLYRNYSLPNTQIKAGLHYISSDDKATDGGIIFLVGGELYEQYKRNIGVDFSYSYYGNYEINKTYTYMRGKFSSTTVTKTISGLSVFQVSPKLGFYIGDYYNYGSFYLETRGYYIGLSDDVGFGKNFLSIEQNISYYYKEFTLSLSGWIGEQTFAVKNDGFVVYNLSEKYKSGYAFSIGYNMNKKTRISAGISQDRFKEINSTKTSELTSLFFTLGATF
ncbi:hypothetical protein [Persephonella sp. IF05-L8]|uniref:hypothetical protein n=1 Tax=Persephonella sp. IF05-L8 TaxID=1158338 RepID=UPI000497C501